MRLVGIATFSVVVETYFKRITCEFSGACCLPGPTTTGGGDRSSRSSLSSYHPDVPGAIVGVFVPRYETDSTFASTSLQRNETAIAFASDERPFLCHFDPAKVLSVSMERAAWPAKVLVVSMGRAAWRAKGSSPVEWCNRFVSFGVGYALSWSGGSSCPVGWGVSRDLVRMSRLR